MARQKTWTRQDGSKGRSWEAIWRDPDGRQRRKAGFSRKRDAQEYEREQRVDITRGSWTDPRHGRLSYEEWARLWWEGYSASLAQSTRNEYERILFSNLVTAFGKQAIAAIGQEDVQRWVNEQDVAPATVAKRYDLLQRSMSAAEAAKRIPHSPCVAVRLPKQQRRRARALKPDQVAALVDAADDRYKAMFLVAAYSGLRLGELAALRIDNVNLLRGEARVTETMEWQRGKPVPREVPKSAAGRRAVGLPSRVVQSLERHLSQFGPNQEGLLFCSPDGSRLRKDNFRRRVWVPAREFALLEPEVRFHDLRHTAASLMIHAGADVLTVSRRLGHAKPSHTMDLYGHWFPDEDSALRSALDSMIDTGSLDGTQSDVLRLAR